MDTPSVRPLSLPGDPPSGATSHVSQGESYRQSTTISMLSENVLLEIFDFYQHDDKYYWPTWDWHVLAHVCHRWRKIVFESPRRLNLHILCREGTPVRKNLGIWPNFPIDIHHYHHSGGISCSPSCEDEIIAALEHHDRVSDISLTATGTLLGKVVTVMQEPFPVLTRLHIRSGNGNPPVLPAAFLGGSAPCLQAIQLDGIPFPALPTLLLSTGDLVTLSFYNIPQTGYISPEAMVACLAALPRLKRFLIQFPSATSRPDRIRLPPATRTVLPALTQIRFKGASEYLEDLISRIDSPQLDLIHIGLVNHRADFQVAQLSKFINRSVGPKLTLFRHALVGFSEDRVSFTVYHHANPFWEQVYQAPMTIETYEGINTWQVSHMVQVLSQFSTTLSKVVHLKLEADSVDEYTDNVGWLPLLHQFSTVRTLHASQEFAGRVTLILEGIAEEIVTEVLPSLDLIYLVGQPAPSIRKFVITRQLSGRPITVVDTEAEFYERLESYVGE